MLVKGRYTQDELWKVVKDVADRSEVSVTPYEYENIVRKLSPDQLRNISQQLFLEVRPDGTLKYHPNLIRYAISTGIPRSQMLDWLRELSTVNNFLIITSIRRTLVTGVIRYDDDIKALEVEDNFKKISDNISLYITLDGDNITTGGIPFYKDIINVHTKGIFTASYFGLGVIPYYVPSFADLYKMKPTYYVSSYNPTKEAADVDFSYNIFMGLFNNIDVIYLMVTNDRAANEIVKLCTQFGGKSLSIDPYPTPRDDGNIWYGFDIISESPYKNVFKTSCIKNLRTRGVGRLGLAFSSAFINYIKTFRSTPIVAFNEYRFTVDTIHSTPNFITFYNAVDKSLFLTSSQKFDKFSEYLVFTGTKYFSYPELRKMLSLQYNYILSYKSRGIRILEGEVLDSFLSTPVPAELRDIFKVFNMDELLYFNSFDISAALGLSQIEGMSNFVQIIKIYL